MEKSEASERVEFYGLFGPAMDAVPKNGRRLVREL